MKTIARMAMAVAVLGLLAACEDEDFIDALAPTVAYGGAHVWGSSDAGLVNGAAAVAKFSNPVNVEPAADGTVYVADFDNNVVRAISPDGVVRTLVQQAGFARPFGLTIGTDSNLYVSTDENDTGGRSPTTGTVWRVNRTTGVATVVARNLGRPRGIVALSDGRIALSDQTHQTIAILNPATGTVQPLAGGLDQAGFANGSGAAARFDRPYGIAVASDGALLVADQNNHRVRRVTLAGDVSTFAGTGVAGSANGPVASATLNLPQDVAVSGGAVFIDDQGNHLVRRVAGGTVTTFAGNGAAGFVDGQGTAAEFFGMEGMAASPDGTLLWIADGNGGDGTKAFNRVRFLPLP